jgi:YHS domain-containing protein
MTKTRMKLLFATAAVALALLTTSARAAEDKEAKKYPLETCVVSGEKLGSMGDPYVFKYKGREVKLCCKGCLKDFNKEPAKYVKKLEEAEAKKK